MITHEEAARSLSDLATGFEGSLSAYAKDLSTGEVLEVAADVVMPTASCIKLFILLALMRCVDTAEFSLDRPMAMAGSDQVGGSGILKTLSPGLKLPLRDVASLMITLSDNTATNMVVDLLGVAGVNDGIAALGFRDTRLVNRVDFAIIGDDLNRFAVSTAREFGSALEGVAHRTLLSHEACETVINIMEQQQYLDLLPRYLPLNPYAKDLGDAGILRVANKTGFFPGFRGDVGLFMFSGKTVVVTALASGGTDKDFAIENRTAQLLGKVGRVVWKRFGPNT